MKMMVVVMMITRRRMRRRRIATVTVVVLATTVIIITIIVVIISNFTDIFVMIIVFVVVASIILITIIAFIHTSGQRLWPNPCRYLDTAADAIRLQQLGHVPFDILKQQAEKEVFEMVSGHRCTCCAWLTPSRALVCRWRILVGCSLSRQHDISGADLFTQF